MKTMIIKSLSIRYVLRKKILYLYKQFIFQQNNVSIFRCSTKKLKKCGILIYTYLL